MQKRSFALLSALSLATGTVAVASPALAQGGGVSGSIPPAEYANEFERFSSNQLDNLVGPIALYPDALLAQVLVASTFPDQVEEAARYVRANGTAGIDDQSWDVSVKAVAHYASALNMMDDKSDWTATLGRAYANQSSDVMAAVQRMRAMAAQQGNLVTTSQQQVITQGTEYVIVPAQPRVIYVPVYDPVVIYTRPIFNVGFSSRYWSFGVGFPIGGWLNYDLDWGRRAVYYNGWNDAYFEYGGGWRARSRPFIQITNVYINPRYRSVYVNRDVYRRPVNYRNVDRYVGVHRDARFEGRRDGNRDWNRDGNRDWNRDGNRNGNDRGDNRGGNDRGRNDPGYTGRTAQPRSENPAATPDGYRNGTARGGDRTPERSRGTVSAPQDRRSEQRVEPVRIEPRRSEPRRTEQPRVEQPRVEQPRIEQRRVEQPRVQPQRTQQPRAEQPRRAEQRQAAPRERSNQGSSDARGSRGGSGGERSARGRSGS